MVLHDPISVRPGTLVLLRGGTYDASGGLFQTVDGAAGNRITYASYPGELAVFSLSQVSTVAEQNPLTVQGKHVVFRDVACQNTSTSRSSGTTGSTFRGEGITVTGDDSWSINNVVLDTGDGIGLWGAGSSAYGNLVLDNGWEGTNRGHGHIAYAQNDYSADGSARSTIKHNVGAFPYGGGIEPKGAGPQISSIYIDENIVMWPGLRSTAAQPLNPFGHYSVTYPSRDMKWRGNIALSKSNVMGSANLWTSGFVETFQHLDCEISDNWLYGDGDGIRWDLHGWSDCTLLRNTIRCLGAYLAEIPNNTDTVASRNYDNNTYLGSASSGKFAWHGTFPDGFGDLPAWRTHTGQEAHSTEASSEPPDRTWLFANSYERGRANVFVWNGNAHATAVTVNADAVLANGDRWYLYNALNPMAGPVATGVYSTGAGISVPMTAAVAGNPRTPAGLSAATNPLPDFGVFVLRKTATWVAPVAADRVAA